MAETSTENRWTYQKDLNFWVNMLPTFNVEQYLKNNFWVLFFFVNKCIKRNRVVWNFYYLVKHKGPKSIFLYVLCSIKYQKFQWIYPFQSDFEAIFLELIARISRLNIFIFYINNTLHEYLLLYLNLFGFF